MRIKEIILLILLGSFVFSCRHYDNFTTYFNTYYNTQRLVKEAETEFQYQEELIKTKPKLVYPESDLSNLLAREQVQSGPPPFMQEFIVSQRQLQPVRVKLDSVIIKGSKILAYHPKSNYIEGSLYLMAKSYFYKNEWLPAQIKCSEMIDKFPDGEFSPDGHLLFSKALLIQKKFHSGKILLSRTVDIAWQKKRYEILSEAFRLQAELALFEGDYQGATRPYRQAIAQCDDNELKANWQFDLASLYYKIGDFEKALEAFRKVRSFSPSYLVTYSSYLYEAYCLSRLGKYEEAERILNSLKKDKKWEEWKDYTHSGFMLNALLKNDSLGFKKLEIEADTAFRTSPPILMVMFEKGLIEYNCGNYNEARKYFARARNVRTPVYSASDRMFNLLNSWEQKLKFAQPLLERLEKGEDLGDTTRLLLAGLLFELGRTFEQLGFQDSTIKYYKLSAEVSPADDSSTARYIYAYSRVIGEKDLLLADSLKEILVEKYPRTIYGRAVLEELGYTSNFLIDSTLELYVSGNRLLKIKDYQLGLAQLKKLYELYPSSALAPRALYRIGYTYERDLINYDSAYHYYQKLLDEYPESVYAQDVKLSVVYYLAVKSGGPIPDSLQERKVIPRPRHPFKGLEIAPPPPRQIESSKEGDKNEGGQFTPLDYIKDPTKIMKDVKEIFSPENLKPQIELPKNPLDEFKKKPDSTEVQQPDVIEPKH